MATRSISHSTHASPRTSPSNSPTSANEAMALPNIKHRAATSTPKKAITGISPLQLHVRKRAKRLFMVWFCHLLLWIKVVDDEGPMDFQIVIQQSTVLLRVVYFYFDRTGHQLALFTQPFRNEWYARIYLYLVGVWHLRYTGGVVAGTKNLSNSTCFGSSYFLQRY